MIAADHGPLGLAPSEPLGADAFPARLRIDVLHGAEDVLDLREEIDALAATAVEANPFYESWMLQPAMKAFATGDVLVLAMRDASGCLAACVPLLRDRRARDLWVPRLQLWRHRYCYACTPLVADGRLDAAIDTLFDWVQRGEGGARLLDLHELLDGGPFARAVEAALARRGWMSYCTRFSRAIYRPHNATAALPSGRRRREQQRLQRRLQARGTVTFDILDRDAAAQPWIEEFLALEDAGWKGRRGSAIARDVAAASFFADSAHGAHRRGRLCMLALRLDGAAVAMQCNFMTGDGGHAFKVAYDERHADASPGLQLEWLAMTHLRDAHASLAWLDSCARPDHPLMNRLWPERRVIVRYIAAQGVAARVPVLLRHALRRLRAGWRALGPVRAAGHAT